MSIPDYQTLMLPLLELASKGETSVLLAVAEIAARFGLTSPFGAGAELGPGKNRRRTACSKIPNDFNTRIRRQPLSPVRANFQKYGFLGQNNRPKSVV